MVETWSVQQEYTVQQTNVTVKGAPGSGYALRITSVYIHVAAAVTVTLNEGTSPMKFNFYGQAAGDGVSAGGIQVKLAVNTSLTITTSNGTTVTLVVSGYTERVG